VTKQIAGYLLSVFTKLKVSPYVNPFKDEEGEPIDRKYQADVTFMREWYS